MDEEMRPREAYKAVVDRSGKSRIQLSLALGRSQGYLQASLAQGSSPSIDLFSKVADLAGYELYAQRGDDRIRIVPENDEDSK